MREGDVIEIYGANVYLPRFPKGARVERVGQGPVSARNPMPDVVERQEALTAVETRRPRFIVVSTGYIWRFLHQWERPDEGWVLPESQRISLADADATAHFRTLFGNTGSYRVSHVSRYEATALLPARSLHSSLACDVVVFERK